MVELILETIRKIPPQAFPATLIILDLLAAGIWLSHGNIRQSIYWIAAAVLTATVTF